MSPESGDELLCIVFTDLVGWTELGDKVGDEAADALRRDHFSAVRAALEAHRGREIKTAGDSFMATFRSALDAVRCAIAVQLAAKPTPLRVRIGVHAGEPIADEDDVFGTAVNIASRLCAAAGPDEVLLSDLTRSLLGRRGGFDLHDAGLLDLKGIRDPVRAYRLAAAGSPSPLAGSDAASRGPKVGAARSMAQPERALLCPVVVERDRELGLLGGVVEAAASGHGSVTALIGEPGVGKTRLSRETLDLASSRGMAVLSGRAVPGPSPVPYRPLTEAFLAEFRSSPPLDVPELAGFEGHLGRLVPQWRSDGAGGPDESPLLVGEAAVRLLRVVGGQRGCTLLLEDLHWADLETLEVVEYLTDALRDEPTLCLLTARPEGPVIDPLARLRRHEGVTVIGVSGLSRDGVEQVVAGCLGTEQIPDDVLTSIGANSEGNPFLVEELLAGLVATGALAFEQGQWTATGLLTPSVPFDFGDSIRRRLSGLDDTSRRVINAAAVLGRRFDWELLPGVAEVDGRAVVDGLRRAVDEQLIETEGTGFKFRHALTREAVLGELLPPERQQLSRLARPAVERAHPGLPGPWCELAAELAEAAGEPTVAAMHLTESAQRALESGALASAETIATRARELAASDQAVLDDVDEVLLQILALAGKPERAELIGDALVQRLTEGSAAATRRADVLTVLARAAVTAGDASRAHDLIERAQGLLSDGDVADAVAARIEAVAAHVALDQARVDDAEVLAEAAIEHASATGQPAVECEALEVLGRLGRDGSLESSVVPFERAATLADQHGLTTWLLRARHEVALLRAYLGHDRQPLIDTRALAARHGALVTVSVMDLALAEIGLGDFNRALCLESAQRCVEASAQFRLATSPVANLWLAGGYALANDEEQMEAAAATALEPDPDDPRILGDLWGRVRFALAAVRDDRWGLRHSLDTMMTFVRVAPITTSIFPNRMFWALVHTIEDDDHGEAARAELATTTHMLAWPVFRVSLDATAAVADGRAGRHEEATARFRTAFEVLNFDTVDWGTALYFVLLASEAAQRDGWGDPAAWVRPAEAFFTDNGYDRIARRCRSLMAAAGAPVPRRGRGDSVVPTELRALGITSREMDVMKLVAEGLTNREIAERLVLSPKTVERHMSSLFDRTGVRSRGALAEFLPDEAE